MSAKYDDSLIEEDRFRYMMMPIEEKREQYKVSKYKNTDSILTWGEYYTSAAKQRATNTPFKINDKLNEQISIEQSDLTTLEVDAIVTSAMANLMGGEGVDRDIHKLAGPKLDKECASLHGADVGDAKTTAGYCLPARFVIHAVCPKGECEEKLKACYIQCLNEMKKHHCRTIAFPPIGVEFYGYPRRKAVHLALPTVREWLENDIYGKYTVERVIFCTNNEEDFAIYLNAMPYYFPIRGTNDRWMAPQSLNTRLERKSLPPQQQQPGEKSGTVDKEDEAQKQLREKERDLRRCHLEPCTATEPCDQKKKFFPPPGPYKTSTKIEHKEDK